MRQLKPKIVNVRLVEEPYYVSSDKVRITTPDHAIAYFGKDLSTYPAEAVEVLYCNTKLRPVYMALVSKGNVDHSIVPFDQIFRIAILTNTSKIILMHNHPSGDIEPSITDKLFTEKMDKACNIMGMSLLDSLVVGANNDYYYSIKDSKKTYFCPPNDYVFSNESDKEQISLESLQPIQNKFYLK